MELRSLILWTCVFLALELPAHFRVVPWYTLSRTVWTGEAWWSPVAVLVAAFVGVLLGHLELHWSVVYLLMVTAAGVALIASHLLEHALT